MDGLKLLAQVALVWLIAGCLGIVAAEPEKPAPGITGEKIQDSDSRPGADDFDTDETLDLDTDSTIDAGEEKSGWQLEGDFRPIADYLETDSRDGGSITDQVLGARLRIGADLGITPQLHLGARLAGTCFTSTDGDGCNPDFIVQLDAPTSSGLDNGQITFDELYLHLHKHERSDVAFGRLQTRFVLRAGVFARSLDRNDSSNVNVTWTDGLHAVYRARNGWRSNFVVQRNASDGSGSVRRDPLDFASSRARNTWFIGFENEQPWGNIVQRGFDVSYLPDSLLKDGVANGRREDYWGIVGRVVALAANIQRHAPQDRGRGGLCARDSHGAGRQSGKRCARFRMGCVRQPDGYSAGASLWSAIRKDRCRVVIVTTVPPQRRDA